MSDPVTNVEIEDVLSSIRRLVTESGGKGEKAESDAVPAEGTGESAAETQPAPEAEPAPIGKLVLTPALRVAEAPDVQPADEAAGEDTQDDANAEPAGEAEDDNLRTQDAGDVETDAQKAAEADVPELGETTPDTNAAEDGSEPANMAQGVGDELKSRIEALEEAVSTQDGEWEDEVQAEETPTEALNWEDHTTEAAPFVASAAFAADAEEFTSDADEDVEEASQPEDDFDFMAGEEAVIDEEALREMVAEAVRLELQGALGERITRNVRKLVRREIHRALMAQELE